jgi:uncharacterized protein
VIESEQENLIQELTSEKSLELPVGTRFGRLGCAQGGQPYDVPFYSAYNNECLHSFFMVRRKIEWMRANPLVCVEADEVVSSEKWASVIVFGRYEEIPDTPDAQSQGKFAHMRNAIRIIAETGLRVKKELLPMKNG